MTDNGARALIQTLVDCGVDICFTNPGTSEMHFVAALDDVPEMRGVLCLFEGVATGAADGYARMAGRPAATLLHLGPGLGNGVANLHNARRAHTPVVNIVGDHATYHKKFDAPLESDIDAISSAVSNWTHRSTDPAKVAEDAATAVGIAIGPPSGVATLILPADTCWLPADGPAAPVAPAAPVPVDEATLAAAADAVQAGPDTVLMIGGRTGVEPATRAAARIAAATGCRVVCETFPARVERGAGLPAIDRLAYLAEFAQMQLDGATRMVLVDTPAPVSFFAYPDKASSLVPDGCEVIVLAGREHDAVNALVALADRVAGDAVPPVVEAHRPDVPSGPLTAEAVAASVGALLPEGAIVVDESNTSGLFLTGATAGAPRHDWLTLTGGSIGIGLPLALGAALAVPHRKVLAMQADGSAMYTLQALWSMGREGCDVTTVIYDNASYAVLNMELNRVGANAGGPKSRAMLDLHQPEIDFVALAHGLGVSATRATTADEFHQQLAAALATSGPNLIEAAVPPLGL